MKKTNKQAKEEAGFRILDEVPKACSTCRFIQLNYAFGSPYCKRLLLQNPFSVRNPEKSVCDNWKA